MHEGGGEISAGAVLYVFPGIDGENLYGKNCTSGAAYIRSVLPPSMAGVGAVVVARNSFAPWESVEKHANASMARLGYTPTKKYALGFSAGGVTLLGNGLADAGWERVFLVDPSVHPRACRALAKNEPVPGLDARVEMTFNAENWKGLFPDTYKALRPLASAINAAGGRAVEYGHYHLKFLREALRTLPLVPSAPSLFEPDASTGRTPASVNLFNGGGVVGTGLLGLFMLLHHRKERIRRDGGFA
jgi:hypothetical protein